MVRRILIRLEETDELAMISDSVAKILSMTKAALAKLALFEYCNKVLERQNARG